MEYLLNYLRGLNDEERQIFYRGIIACYDDMTLTDAQFSKIKKTAKKLNDVVL